MDHALPLAILAAGLDWAVLRDGKGLLAGLHVFVFVPQAFDG